MKYIWTFLIAAGIVLCILGRETNAALIAMIEGAAGGLTLCVSLAAGCILFMGFAGVAEEAKLLAKLADAVGGVAGRLFPGVRRGGGAASMISLNLAANMLGLGNAATPFGLKAMRELHALQPGNTASAAMCMLLCVNISSIQIVPVNVIALRAQYGAQNPSDIMLPELLITIATTTTAILLARLCESK